MEKWESVGTAPNQMAAEIWLEILRENGIEGRLSADDVISFLGVSSRPVRVLVRDDEIELAREILASSAAEPDEASGDS